MYRALPVDMIDTRSDARMVDQAAVTSLAESISGIGLISPIRVRAINDRWEVIAGVHRLEAHRLLGLVEIAANVIESDDLDAELAMIDENLCRTELSPADRATWTARRKAIYLIKHPETAEHVAGATAKHAAENFSAAPSFAVDTANKTGQSDRIIRMHAERGEKIIPEVIDLIRGTKLDTGSYLDKMKRLSPNDQFTAAKRDLAHQRSLEREKASSLQRRVAPMTEYEVRAKQVDILMAAWNKASPEARQEFLAQIDTPVFDRNAAA